MAAMISDGELAIGVIEASNGKTEDYYKKSDYKQAWCV